MPAPKDELPRELERLHAAISGVRHGNAALIEAMLSEVDDVPGLSTWLWDVSADQVRWSDALYQLLGYDRGEVPASIEAYFARVHPEDRAQARRLARQSVTARESTALHYRLRLPSGEVRHVIHYDAFVFGPDDELRFVVSLALDTTSAHPPVQPQPLREDLMRSADAHARLAFLSIHSESGSRWWSPGVWRILGLDESVEPSREAFLACIHPDDVRGMGRALKAVSGGATDISFDFRVLGRSDRVRYLRGFGSLLDGWVSCVLVDISDEHRLRERLLEAERLEGVGRLAGGVAHDVNNIMMVVSTIAAELEETDPEKAEELAWAVRSASSLTKGLLSLSGRGELTTRETDLTEVIDQVAAKVESLLPPGIHLSTTYGPAVPTVQANPTQIELAILNIVINARDAIGASGTIAIGVASKKNGWVKVSISDDGPGMSDVVREHAFDPFFTTKEPGKGTGLGLALVRTTIQRHGGRVGLHATPGAGTRVIIDLPVGGPGSGSSQAELRPRSRTASLRVLVLDDNHGVRGALARTLRASGHEVIEAALPSEARRIARARAGALDVLVSDLVMPEMLGPALVAALQEDDTCPTAVVYVTGYDQSAQNMLDSGDIVLPKPCGRAELNDAIERAMSEAN